MAFAVQKFARVAVPVNKEFNACAVRLSFYPFPSASALSKFYVPLHSSQSPIEASPLAGLLPQGGNALATEVSTIKHQTERSIALMGRYYFYSRMAKTSPDQLLTKNFVEKARAGGPAMASAG